MNISDFAGLFTSYFQYMFNLITILLSSIKNGFIFFTSLFSTVPNYLFDILYDLPPFFRIGLLGTLGIVLFIIVLKVLSILFLQGG